MNIVTIQNLKKYYGKRENQVKALDGIDLSKAVSSRCSD